MDPFRASILHGAATASLAGLLSVAFALGPGPVRRVAVGGVALLVVGGALFALFGDGDWTTGGGHRRHATFLVVYGALAGGGTILLAAIVDPVGPLGRALQVLAFVYALAVAGWLAYLGGTRRLVRAWGRALGLARTGDSSGARGD